MLTSARGRDPAGAEKDVVIKKFAVDPLRSRITEIEDRSDIGKCRKRRRPEDRYAVLKITEELRIAADEAEVA